LGGKTGGGGANAKEKQQMVTAQQGMEEATSKATASDAMGGGRLA
jgi:hypothetical protein